MTRQIQRLTAALASGALFGTGLAVSGMTQPPKVTGFLDFFGNWDPSLALVMFGAVAVHFVATRGILRSPAPLLDGAFRMPSRRDIDRPLVLGAVVFGLGWGLSGFCPGPALTAATSGGSEVWLFLFGMTLGMLVFKWLGRFNVGSRDAEELKLIHSPKRVKVG